MGRYVFVPLLAVLGLMMVVGAKPAAAEMAGSELAQSGDVMQCMEQCLRTEGKSEKATCKSRCANVSTRPPKQKDCMAVYKSCLRNCGADKSCKRTCKSRLMNCS